LSGYPAIPQALILSTDFANRTLNKLRIFPLTVGTFHALDFFQDSSFYLPDALGHAIGHLNALARTTSSLDGPSTFMYLGADSFHHGSRLRLNKYLPYPPPSP
jgi:hypothetical protein